MKKTKMSSIRLEEDLLAKWRETYERANRDSSELIRELITAAIRYHDRNGNLYPPFELVPGARMPEEKITYTVTAPHGVAIAGDNNGTVHVGKKRRKA